MLQNRLTHPHFLARGSVQAGIFLVPKAAELLALEYMAQTEVRLDGADYNRHPAKRKGISQLNEQAGYYYGGAFWKKVLVSATASASTSLLSVGFSTIR